MMRVKPFLEYTSYFHKTASRPIFFPQHHYRPLRLIKKRQNENQPLMSCLHPDPGHSTAFQKHSCNEKPRSFFFNAIVFVSFFPR